jgi:hypothetical protein
MIFAASQFTLSLVTTTTEKLTVKFLCDKQENQFKLQDGELNHRIVGQNHSKAGQNSYFTGTV